ncbi:MAG: ABC transporter ATP-binding protein [Clostridia bacterium]|nr:ABC transporter ATP-binding protein [Clostridia bacterium]
MEAILEFKDVNYTYPGASKKTLKDLNAAFEAGRLYVIYGPSGSGKTTALALAGALDVPGSGRVLFRGEDIRKGGLQNHRKNHVAFIFQNYNLLPYMTALENVTSAMDIAGAGGADSAVRKAHAKELLISLGLEEDEIRRNVLKLSGGQQQRVAIARALACDAEVILADEPTGNLDPETAEEIADVLCRLAHDRGKCVIAVSHSTELAGIADVTLVFRKGTLTPAVKAVAAPEE